MIGLKSHFDLYFSILLSFIGVFEESKENKLEYTDVFTAYTNMVETTLEQYLSSRIPVSSLTDKFIFAE